MKKLFGVIPAILFSLCLSEAKTVDRILAKVNDDIITLQELKQEMTEVRKILETKYSGEQLEQALQKEEKQVLEKMVRDKLIDQKAMEVGADQDSDSEVSAYLQQIVKENNFKDIDELEQELLKDGKSLKDFREQIQKSFIRQQLVGSFVGSRVSLLPPEIEKYYKDHIPDYTSTEEVTLSEIIIPNSEEAENRANDLYHRLQQGESFAALASQFSKGSTANKGGNIGTYLVTNLRPEDVKAIANLKEGEVTKPQKTKDGYLIYHIDSRKYATVRPLEEVQDEIRKHLIDQKRSQEYERFITQLKEDAYIQYF
jgi:peptidyl-prolyl cis-trans isomerase SurA